VPEASVARPAGSILSDVGNGSTGNGAQAASSRARGRAASLQELKRSLATAPPGYLAGALENAELGPDEVRLVVRNRRAPAMVLARIGANGEWARIREVRSGLIRHANTPLATASDLARRLPRKDLAEIAEDVRVRPALRRLAEEILKASLEEMPLGEKVSLARRCGGTLIGALRESSEAGVLRALLRNARFVETDAVRIASAPGTPGEVLRALAEDPVWGARRPVRMALLHNRRTPVASALGLIRRMSLRDRERLAEDREAPRIVRVGAERDLRDVPDG
jgi:hypothetical protein